MTFDLKITGGLVYDGCGGDAVRADVAVKDGVIVTLHCGEVTCWE